ncbi:MAG: sigma-54 dependent transcriptional regulator [Alphaproteobacteria bacterium]
MVAHILQVGSPEGASALAACAMAAKVKLMAAQDMAQAMEVLTTKPVALVFAASTLDLSALLTQLAANKINVPVVACGPATPVQNAVKAIRLGAVEYLPTPLEPELITALIARFKPTETSFEPIYGDPKTAELLAQARQFAASHASVLLRGESGTGKEVFSKFIHLASPRKEKEFVAVNCAAIPEALLESELFGHEKGAFSGAVAKRIGRFQQADQGTLLLDEISEMDLSLQAKLLRAIQERVIDPVGSSSPVPIDIRLIATTNRQLEDYVAEGSFREDLYFRLNVVMLEIPPLRERVGDIAPLARFFAEKYGKQNGRDATPISPEALEKLEGCYWKGNVRELENTMHRAVLMLGEGESLQPAHIVISPMSLQMMGQDANNAQAAASASRTIMGGGMAASAAAGVARAYASGGTTKPVTRPTNPDFIGQSLQDVERQHILSTLTYCRGNREVAADVLGISIKILKQKLDEYHQAG